MQGLGIPGLARERVVAPRGLEVLLNSNALLVETAEPELGRRQSLLGGALEPFHRRLEVL